MSKEKEADKTIIELISNEDMLNKRLKDIDNELSEEVLENANKTYETFRELDSFKFPKYDILDERDFDHAMRTRVKKIAEKTERVYHNYYSSQLDAFTDESHLMLVPIDDKMALNCHCIRKTVYIYDGKIYFLKSTIEGLLEESQKLLISSPMKQIEIEQIIKTMFSYTAKLNDVEIHIYLTAGYGSLELKPSFYDTQSEMYEGTLYLHCVEKKKRVSRCEEAKRCLGLKMNTKVEEYKDLRKYHNNNNLVSAIEHIRSIKDGFNDKIILEEIDGQQYIRSIRDKNIFIVYDYKDYFTRLKDKERLEIEADTTINQYEREHKLQEIAKNIYKIPSDEPPVFVYPSNFSLQDDGKKFYNVVENNLFQFGIISYYEKKLVPKEQLKYAKEVILVDDEFLYNLNEVNEYKYSEKAMNSIRDNLKNMFLSYKMLNEKVSKVYYDQKMSGIDPVKLDGPAKTKLVNMIRERYQIVGKLLKGYDGFDPHKLKEKERIIWSQFSEEMRNKNQYYNKINQTK